MHLSHSNAVQRLKVRAAGCLGNYRGTGRAVYLDRAIAATRAALAVHLGGSGVEHGRVLSRGDSGGR